LSDFIFIAIGIFAHYSAAPYFGLRFQGYKIIDNKDNFIPFKKWMVPGGNRELSGHEYEEFLKNSFSSLGEEKLQQLKEKGSITIFDQTNMYLFEEQVGLPKQHINDDKNLKNSIKSRF
jgi:hypothetical protein